MAYTLPPKIYAIDWWPKQNPKILSLGFFRYAINSIDINWFIYGIF